MTEIITLKINKNHMMWIRKGLPRDVGEKHPVLFPFPSHGYKYLGIYTKQLNNKEDKPKWKKTKKQ